GASSSAEGSAPGRARAGSATERARRERTRRPREEVMGRIPGGFAERFPHRGQRARPLGVQAPTPSPTEFLAAPAGGLGSLRTAPRVRMPDLPFRLRGGVPATRRTRRERGTATTRVRGRRPLPVPHPLRALTVLKVLT